MVGNSPAVQWLGLHTSTVGGLGLIPCLETKILQAMQFSKTWINKYPLLFNVSFSRILMKNSYVILILKSLFYQINL